MSKPSQKSEIAYWSTIATLSGWGFAVAEWIQDSCRIWENQTQTKLGVQQAKGPSCSEAARLQAGKRTSSCGLQSSVSLSVLWPKTTPCNRNDLLKSFFAKTFSAKKIKFWVFLCVLSPSKPIPMIPLVNMPRFYSFNLKQDDFISVLWHLILLFKASLLESWDCMNMPTLNAFKET